MKEHPRAATRRCSETEKHRKNVPAWKDYSTFPGRAQQKGDCMNKWYEKAAEKLQAEKAAGKYDKCASIMKDDVCKALDVFCRQDEEFAQAVVQGGTFTDCMKAVARNCGNGISDLEAFRRAVRFYFPGAGVRFHMTVNLCAGVEAEEQAPAAAPKILDLDDYL